MKQDETDTDFTIPKLGYNARVSRKLNKSKEVQATLCGEFTKRLMSALIEDVSSADTFLSQTNGDLPSMPAGLGLSVPLPNLEERIREELKCLDLLEEVRSFYFVFTPITYFYCSLKMMTKYVLKFG